MNQPYFEVPQPNLAEDRLESHEKGCSEICPELKRLLADVFAIYIKTKNFHWHMSGPHFRDYHLLLDEQADQLFSMTDAIAERGRKLRGDTLRSIGEIARLQRVRDSDDKSVTPEAMLDELVLDNRTLTDDLRTTHGVCERLGDDRELD